MNAVIYARFSTDEQREESIEDQFRMCGRTAQQYGLNVVAHYKDEGISGGTADRPGYQALLSAARAGDFAIILAEDISRLWRSRAEYGARSAELEDLGIDLITCVGDDTRRDGWGLILGVKQAIAESQRKEISFRTRRGLEGLAMAGKSTGGRCFGYAAGQSVDPRQASIVNTMFFYAARGNSTRDIAAWLNDVGYTSPTGRGPWTHSTVAAILRNPRYVGTVIWGRTETKTSAQDSRRKRRVMRAGEGVIIRQDEARAIVSQDLFDAVQQKLSARRRCPV